MNKINIWLHILNLLFTNTCDRDDFYKKDDSNTKPIDIKKALALMI